MTAKGKDSMMALHSFPDADTGSDDSAQRDPRSGRIFSATLTTQNGIEQSITIRNVSPNGLGARAAAPPPIGDAVSIMLGPFGTITGKVRWVRGSQFGILLDTPIDPAQFNFSNRSWTGIGLTENPYQVANRFKPATSTWRPGFGTR